jgi:hypothetical protein
MPLHVTLKIQHLMIFFAKKIMSVLLIFVGFFVVFFVINTGAYCHGAPMRFALVQMTIMALAICLLLS